MRRSFALLLPCVLLATCKGGDDTEDTGTHDVLPDDGVLAGSYVVDALVVGEDETLVAAGDVVIEVTGDAPVHIAGRIEGQTRDDDQGASITVKATGDIVVSGSVAAGDGAEVGGERAKGGSVTLETDGELDLSEAEEVAAGDGGGGEAGAAGGAGGDLVLEGETVRIEVREGYLAAGSGGDGGDEELGWDALFALRSDTGVVSWTSTAGGGAGGDLEITGSIAWVGEVSDLESVQPFGGGPAVTPGRWRCGRSPRRGGRGGGPRSRSPGPCTR